jgi:hypothetical protein
MYNQVFVRLLIAATITFVVIFVAASLYLLPLGQRSVGAVVPVVDDFMRAGAAGDTLAARLLLSSDALGSPGRADMDRLLGQADLFAGYDGLATESFELLPSAERGGTDMAALRATVHYTGAPSARLDAVLVLENDRWRINDLRIAPSAPSP